EQDIYLFGEDRPVKEFSGRVIAVLHRYNDNEDKWIVSADGKDRTDEQIKEATDFQEKYFDGEIFR
ncbi:MAG: inorganic pyrophosphatase, partial [Ruminiclostridium sp.]|nr:inorganic pyrophosphatase [Ruminiclostridium sp.]